MDLVRYARIAIYVGLFTIPFTVLFVADWLYFPFITGKNFAFRVIVEIVFALWVFVALYQPEFRPRKSLALILGALFVVAIGISTLLAETPAKAFWSNFERMEGYITILHLAAYTVVLTSMLKTEEWWKRFFQVSLGVSFLVALYAILQLTGALTINQGGVRVDATFGNATYFAVYMLIHAFLALYAAVRWSGGQRVLQVLYGGLFILNTVLVFYSATRGSILGLVGGLFLTGLIALAVGSGRARAFGIGAVVAVLIIAAGFFAVKDTEYVRTHPIFERLASVSLSSGDTRFAIWNMAYQGFLERPVFGWGQEGFNYVFNKYYQPELYTQEPWFDRAHNVFLDWLVAGGVVGMLLYVSLYLVLLWYLWRPGSRFDAGERALLTGLIAAYGFHNLFVFDNLTSYFLFFALFSYITVRSMPPTQETGAPLLHESTTSIAGSVALVGVLVLVYAVNSSGYASAYDLIEGLKPHPEGVTKNLEYFVAASERSGLGQQEVGEQFLQFAIQLRALGIGTQDFHLEAAGAARTAFERVIAESPNDARLLAFFASFLRQYGDVTAAREFVDRALVASPGKQGIMIEQGLIEYTARNYQEALAIFGDVYASAPDFNQVATMYAGTAIVAGDEALAEELLNRHFGTDTPNDLTILQSYIEARQLGKALTIAERRLAADPSSASYQLLAGVYLEMGNRAEAIRTLERAIVADPSFKAQGEAFIRDINSGAL